MIWIPPSTLGAWEEKLVDHFLAIGRDGDASDIRSFEVTPSTLTAACGADAQSEELVEAAFRRQLLCDRPLLVNTLQRGPQRRSTDRLPNFFVHLALTLFIDSRLDGDYAHEGAFRSKLAAWLDVGHGFQDLTGVAQMWRSLVAWLHERVEAGAPFRRLILPEIPLTWTHIGYTRRLSFPSRTDIRLLDRFASEHPRAVADPRIVLNEFPQMLLDKRASWGLKSAFEDFRQSFLRQRRALADHRFWRLITRVRADQGRTEANVAAVEMTFDEDGREVYFGHSGPEAEIRAYANFEDALAGAGAVSSDNLAPAVARGVLFFRQSGTGRWRAEPDLENWPSGAHVAFTSRRITLVGGRLGPLRSGREWSITVEPQPVRKIEESLERIGLRFPRVERIVRPSVSNGVHVQSAWLGRPRFLPALDADSFELTVRGEAANPNEVTPLSVDNGQLLAASLVEGSYVVEPTLAPGESHPPWSLRLQFVRDALPHPVIDGTRHRLPRLLDWSAIRRAPTVWDACEPLGWEDGKVACEDLLEAIYADGAKGWEEADVVDLVRRSGSDISPWTMLRCLQDAGLMEPRLRERWRGRAWTLVAPSIVRVRAVPDDLVLVEGALCARLIEDFRMAVEGAGGTCFRRVGVGEWSPPVIGAVGVPPETIAERLNWPLIGEADTPSATPLAFEVTTRHAELYQLASTWDWDNRCFVNRAVVDRAVRLTRRVHPTGTDHDVYRVEHRGRLTHYLSRVAAIGAAHSAASTPMFGLRGDRLVRLAGDGGLPDAIATGLRRRRLRSAGPVGDVYAYPATQDDARWVAKLLPGCVSEVTSVPDQNFGSVISAARRSGGRLRPQWRKGVLVL